MNKFLPVFILILVAITTAQATEYFNWNPIKITTPEDGLLHWERVEVYQDRHPGFAKEKILDCCKYKNPQLRAVFPENLYDGDAADASLMALFYAPGWKNSRKTPILLIPGAADNVFRGWVHPYSFATPETIPVAKEGFMQKFVRAGYPVFAINFSHNQGCNYQQAEQIYNAIQIIKRRTGADKVNLLAHSKGNCATCIYLCGGCEVYPERFSWISPFEKDVAVYIQAGPANKGIDLNFRYYTANLTVVMQNAPAPLCFYKGMVYGFWKEFYDRDVYLENPGPDLGNYFPGQNQIVYNLVDDGLDFSVYSYTPFDINMTMKACYYGGRTLVVEAYGIDHAAEEGGHTIKRINARGLHPSVKLINVYGTDPVIQKIDFIFFKIPVGIPDYPSDGVIYVHSASYIQGLISRGATLIAQKSFKKNHVFLAAHQEVFTWLDQQLEQQ